jgi:hypothetical protein
LIAEGWTVLHNTRHSPLEFGKDVIARSPEGSLVALQLKGNPGSRVTKSEAQSLIPQLTELLDIPVPATFMKKAGERHLAVFVTNGDIDEEARLLMEQLAQRSSAPGSPSVGIAFWTRGQLLARIRARMGSIWPASLEGIRLLLDLQAISGDRLPDSQAVSKVLEISVGRPTSKMSSAEKTAKVTSCLLLAEIIKNPWRQTQNHYALYQITVLAAVFCLRFADSESRRRIIETYLDHLRDHCVDLLNEAQARNFDPELIWGERDILAEIDIMTERARLVADCAATLVLSGGAILPSLRNYCRDLIASSFGPRSIWGHAAVPAGVVRVWALRRVDATLTPDRILYSLLLGLLHAARDKGGRGIGLPAPYYDFEACIHLHSNGVIGCETDIANDNMRHRAWFSRALFFMLAKRNLKRTCKQTWYQFSKVMHEVPEYPAQDFFSAQLSSRGRTETHQFYDETWQDLIIKAVRVGEESFLVSHARFAWLIAAYVAVVPFRAWDSALLWLDSELNETWYKGERLPR